MKTRILFLGNPGYGGLLLEELLRFDVEVVGVFSRTTRLWSRCRKTYRRYLTSRKKLAEAMHRLRTKVGSLLDEQGPMLHFGKDVIPIARHHGLRMFDGSEVRRPRCHSLLRQLDVDVILVASFSEFLPLPMLHLPKLAAINMHPSLLPKYRGGFPEFAAIYNGEPATGITFHLMEERFDSGNILLQREVSISERETTLTLKNRLAKLACHALPDLLNLIARGKLTGRQQDASAVSYCRLKGSFDRITPGMTVRQIQHIIDACHDVEDIGTPHLLVGRAWLQALSYGDAGISFDAADGRIWLDLIRYRHKMYAKEQLRGLASSLGVDYRG